MPEDGAIRKDPPAAADLHRRRITVSAELAILAGTTVLVYGLGAHFDWFETVAGWIPDRRNVRQLHELVYPAVFLIVGLSIFAFRRWRESEAEVTSRRQTHEALRLLHDELDVRIKQRTAELREANDALRAEVVERTRADATLRNANRHLRAVSECNQVLVRATDETRLLHDICRIVVEHAGYRLAWVGFAEQDEAKSVRPVAHHGFEEGYLDTLRITWADTERGRGPTGTAIRTGQPCAVQNILEDPRFLPWRDEALRRGCVTSIALPLTIEGRVLGTLNIYAAELGAFDAEEIGVLTELADDLAYGITALRTRAERERAEAALRESEMRFKDLFDHAPVGYHELDAEGRLTRINETELKMLGYSAEELLGQFVWTLAAEEEFSRQAVLAKLGGLPPPPAYERTFRRKDGSTFPVLVEDRMLKKEDGTISGIRTVIQDITERKRAEAALRQSEERYRLVFENNPLPMWLHDLETLRFLAVNESAVQHYGYTREEFLGMTIKQIHAPEDIPALLKSVEEGRAESKSSSEWRHRRKDGTIIYVEIISRPLVFDRRDALLVLAADVTGKKLLEDKFLHAQRLESLGMLASGIAHDLNNVLAPIVFAAPMLRDSLSAPRDMKILDILEQSAGRGAGLVKQILGFVHCTTGGFRPTQVKHLARDIISVIEQTFPKSIQLQHQIPSDLWPVQGNATQIHQVLLNLCINARDAMSQGGMLRITAANRRLDAAEAGTIPGARPGSWLVLEVADTGTGIPPEILERIWEPFFTTKAPGKGTGLGLSTVRGIVASHLGFIQLEAAVGKGTTFRVFLPAATTELPRAGNVSPAAVAHGGGELILIVDDDQAIREIVAAILSQHGYRVVTCADGVEAITRFNVQPGEFALVVTDVDMPHLGGAVLARVLLQLRPDVRLLAMSGLSGRGQDGPDVRTARELAHAFLLKPFTPEDLLGTVHRLLHPPEKP